MPKLSRKFSLSIGILIFLVTVVMTIKAVSAYLKPSLKATTAVRMKGSPQAPVKIIEYIDFQCPACGKGVKLLEEYFKLYPNKIHLTVKYFPLEGIHAHAIRSARYAECAARQGKFWPFLELLAARRDQWEKLINADPAFGQMAKEVQLDPFQLEACLTSDDPKRVILEDKKEGEALGVQSTPTYFINEKMVVGTKSLQEELNVLAGPIAAAPEGESH